MDLESYLEKYQRSIISQLDREYTLAKTVRAKGLDVSTEVEIPLATDMADRVEELIGVPGIASEIRKLSKEMTREELAIEISRSVARRYSEAEKETALDKSVRVGLAILTEGISVAPLEGISRIKINKNTDGSTYASIVYAGPIRGAGATAQAMSVLITDIVRRDLEIGKFIATPEEEDRYIEEVQDYNRRKHLQYLPSKEEIREVVKKSPICIDGEGSEEEEVSGHRDMQRIETNRIRGGMCLVLCEGLIQKARKVKKYTDKLGLSEWNFLGSGGEKSTNEEKPVAHVSDKFLKDIVAGRPVFSHPGRPGGFRLRYGRSRVSGLAAVSINPATMVILDSFIAVGSQIKTELPGKAAAITPCENIDGPMVLLNDGRHIRVNDEKEARNVVKDVEQITDIGEILVSYGEFLENNRRLLPGSFNLEWWLEIIRSSGKSIDSEKKLDHFEAVEISRKNGIPLYPEYDYFWHDLSAEEILYLREKAMQSYIDNNMLVLPTDKRILDILVKLGVEFRSHLNVSIENYYPFIVCLGLDLKDRKIIVREQNVKGDDPVALVNKLSGIRIIPRSPTRIGARLGRPEKAGDRKMKPKVHLLFPVENYGDSRRSLKNAEKNTLSGYEVEVDLRRCKNCGSETCVPRCPNCGSLTEDTHTIKKVKINLSEMIKSATENLEVTIPDKLEIKGVKGLISNSKTCEPIEKGLIRALHDVTINKDGTCRYDMSDIPITHFRLSEIGLSEEKAIELGYEISEFIEIFPQDIIMPLSSAEYLLRVSKYIDDLLVKYYGLAPYYMCETASDLIGQLVIGLAPHTSGGIVGRIIGFADVSGCYAHPLYHAAKRRNCDGDEDSVMLLLDGLLNFSRSFLPSTTGGLMDAPLVLTVRLNPDEVDKEALNVDTMYTYPLQFYDATIEGKMASEIESFMITTGKLLQTTGVAMGMGFTTRTEKIDSGVKICSYKSIGTMEEKIERQLSLAQIIRAVDADDVAVRVLSSHFLPDIFGNFRKFFSQEFRCSKCNTKYRRVPLSGKCRKCGNKSIILTIHKGSIVKYLDETIKVAKEYKMPWYVTAQVENISRTIKDTFADDDKPEITQDKNHSIKIEEFEGDDE